MATGKKTDLFSSKYEGQSLDNIGRATEESKYLGVRYRMNIKDHKLETSSIALSIDKPREEKDLFIRNFVEKWDKNQKNVNKQIDYIQHPDFKYWVIVLRSDKKEDLADKIYYGECSDGYIKFFVDSVKVTNVTKSKENNLKFLIDVARKLNTAVMKKDRPEKKSFFGGLAGMFKGK
jgi:hypothetical protein